MSRAAQQVVYEKLVRERAEQQDADLAAVLDTAAGRRFVMGFLARGGVWQRLGVEKDPVRMAYAIGRRDVCCDLLSQCNRVATAKMQIAMDENNERMEKWAEQMRSAKAKGEDDEW